METNNDNPAVRAQIAALIQSATPLEMLPEYGDSTIVADGDLHLQVDRLDRALCEVSPSRPPILQRGGMLVHLVRRPLPGSPDDLGPLVVIPVTEPRIREEATRIVSWSRMDRKGRAKPINCPRDVALSYLARAAWGVPVLKAIIEHPTMRADGSMLTEPGYDPPTGAYFDPGKTQFPAIQDRPDRASALAALAHLREPLEEVAFSRPRDVSIAIAHMLTQIVRPSLPAAPIFGYSAETFGVGKTYTAQAASILATGRTTTPIVPPRDQSEFDKTLGAAVLYAPAALLLDNLEFTVQSEVLSSLTTGGETEIRVLGKSETIKVTAPTMLVITGNGLSVAKDLAMRVLICRLHAGDEHPELRRFSGDLHARIRRDRAHLVACALTILRAAWLAADDMPDVEPWARFPEWDKMVRRPLIWLGLPDPFDAVSDAAVNDPHRLEHASVLHAWLGEFGNQRVTLRSVVDRARDRAPVAPEMHDALEAVAGERGSINVKRLGRWVAKLDG